MYVDTIMRDIRAEQDSYTGLLVIDARSSARAISFSIIEFEKFCLKKKKNRNK